MTPEMQLLNRGFELWSNIIVVVFVLGCLLVVCEILRLYFLTHHSEKIEGALRKLSNLFSVDEGLEQACDFYERKWYEECIAHAKTKLLLAEQAAEFKSGNTLNTWPEDDVLQEAVDQARQELYEAEEYLRRIS